MQRYEIHLLPEDGRFQLCDDDAAAGGAIEVDVQSQGEIAVAIVLHAARPEIDASSWNVIGEGDLRIESGRLVVTTATESFPEAFRITLRRGHYRALLSRGEREYLIALYPAVEEAREGAVRVHRLDASHVAEYRELMLRAYREAPDAFTSTPEERASAPDSWWLKRIADARGANVAFGAFEDHELVGTVAVEFSSRAKTRHKAHVIGMFVSSRARGRGAARRLVDAAIAHCKAREDIACITLTVTEGNEPAIRLYRSVGFREFGVEPLAIRASDGYRAKVHMQLVLSEAM